MKERNTKRKKQIKTGHELELIVYKHVKRRSRKVTAADLDGRTKPLDLGTWLSCSCYNEGLSHCKCPKYKLIFLEKIHAKKTK